MARMNMFLPYTYEVLVNPRLHISSPSAACKNYAENRPYERKKIELQKDDEHLLLGMHR